MSALGCFSKGRRSPSMPATRSGWWGGTEPARRRCCGPSSVISRRRREPSSAPATLATSRRRRRYPISSTPTPRPWSGSSRRATSGRSSGASRKPDGRSRDWTERRGDRAIGRFARASRTSSRHAAGSPPRRRRSRWRPRSASGPASSASRCGRCRWAAAPCRTGPDPVRRNRHPPARRANQPFGPRCQGVAGPVSRQLPRWSPRRQSRPTAAR